MASRCDIIRDAVEAATCGLCGGSPNCPPGLDEKKGGLCRLGPAANARLAAFAALPPWSYGGGAARRLARADLAAAVAGGEAALAAAYPGAEPGAAEVAWGDFNGCLLSPDGAKDPATGRRRMGRAEAELVGLAPVYPLGGKAAAGLIWRRGPAPVPLGVDAFANPDLFVLVLAALLAAAVAAAAFGAARAKRRGGPQGGGPQGGLRPKAAAKLEAAAARASPAAA
jgi:hypothetical protein